MKHIIKFCEGHNISYNQDLSLFIFKIGNKTYAVTEKHLEQENIQSIKVRNPLLKDTIYPPVGFYTIWIIKHKRALRSLYLNLKNLHKIKLSKGLK